MLAASAAAQAGAHRRTSDVGGPGTMVGCAATGHRAPSPSSPRCTRCATRCATCWPSRPKRRARTRRSPRRGRSRSPGTASTSTTGGRSTAPVSRSCTAAGPIRRPASPSCACDVRTSRVSAAIPTITRSWPSRCTTSRPGRPAPRRSCSAGCTGGRRPSSGWPTCTRRCSCVWARAASTLTGVADLLGLPDADAAIEALGDLVFRDPQRDGAWVSRREYLSGDVRAKRAVAEQAALVDRAYRRNVAALAEAVPSEVGPLDIAVSLGAPWIAAEDVEAFVHEVLGGRVKVWHLPSAASWKIDAHRQGAGRRVRHVQHAAHEGLRPADRRAQRALADRVRHRGRAGTPPAGPQPGGQPGRAGTADRTPRPLPHLGVGGRRPHHPSRARVQPAVQHPRGAPPRRIAADLPRAGRRSRAVALAARHRRPGRLVTRHALRARRRRRQDPLNGVRRRHRAPAGAGGQAGDRRPGTPGGADRPGGPTGLSVRGVPRPGRGRPAIAPGAGRPLRDRRVGRGDRLARHVERAARTAGGRAAVAAGPGATRSRRRSAAAEAGATAGRC